MEILTLISIIIGILAGIIAILEKFFHILPWSRGPRKLFDREFSLWKESSYSHIARHEDFRRFAGFVIKNQLDGERNTFALLCAIQHGDKLMHVLTHKNEDNSSAIPFVFDFISGRGIRVGWRAEYVLSGMNREKVMNFIDHLPEETKESITVKASIQRIIEDKVEKFVLSQLEGDDRKLRTYANEVLNQIQSKFAPRPQPLKNS
ncbi:hypothetical protein ACFL36_01310 [Thermodesulfobacteriota bacterium]